MSSQRTSSAKARALRRALTVIRSISKPELLERIADLDHRAAALDRMAMDMAMFKRVGERLGRVATPALELTFAVELLRHALGDYGNCDSADDAAFERVGDNLVAAAVNYLCASEKAAMSRAVRKALRAKRATGIQLGRPRRLTEDAMQAALSADDSMARVAEKLGVSRWTLRRAIKRRGSGKRKP